MAEFTRLSDVETIAEPSEMANVLIEENGVIKKAPKTAVGGGGGQTLCLIVDRFGGGGVLAPSNAFEMLEDFLNNCTPIAIMMLIRNDRDGKPQYFNRVPDGIYYNDSYDEIVVGNDSYGLNVYIRRDGNHSFYED